MTKRIDILNELKELGSKLPVTPLENIYTVPGGYFEGFASQVMARIKAMEAADANEELSHLSPYLKSLPVQNPYKAPAGYFEGLEEKIMDAVRVDADYQTTDEELESLSPLLNSLKNVNPYSVPREYFENLSAPVTKESKIISITNRKWFRIAVAAIVIGLIAILGITIITNKPSAGIARIEKKVVKEINKSSDEELKDFIQNTGTTDVAMVEKKPDVESKDLLKDIPDEELNQFVNEIAEPETESSEPILN